MNLLNLIIKNEKYINQKYKYKYAHPIHTIKSIIYRKQNKRINSNFENEIEKAYHNKKKQIIMLENLISSYTNGFEKEIEKRSEKDISQIIYILKTIESLDTIYYGAIGEIHAVKELSKLPKSFYIINDYQLEFFKPIYDKRNNDRIHSIQLDHIVVGPTGIFIIETKNWSQKSLNNLDLFSPIKQLKRSSFALFFYLNSLVDNYELKYFRTHWGNLKISVNNILLMTNATTQENFQYIKVTTLKTINKYITNHSIVFNERQISELVHLLTRNKKCT